MPAGRFLIMLAAIGGLLAAPVAAYAGPGYPIEPPAAVVSAATIPAGGAVVFSGRGFLPSEPISIDVSYQATGAALHSTGRAVFVGAVYRTVTASSSGAFSTSIRLNHTGRAKLIATGNISHVVVSQLVTAVAAGSVRTLALTGQSGQHWMTEIAVGLGAILVGGLLAFTATRLHSRRPRRTHLDLDALDLLMTKGYQRAFRSASTSARGAVGSCGERADAVER
jgi:hypothetical protein